VSKYKQNEKEKKKNSTLEKTLILQLKVEM
ncbi:unnamed protein product, partial [marine sediment metagenome]